MRSTLRIALAFALVTISACRQAPQPPPKKAVSAPCQAAEAFIRQWLTGLGPGSYIFSNQPQLDFPGPNPKDWRRYRFGQNESITPPADTLVDAAEELEQHSAGRGCPSVQNLLSKRHIPFEQPIGKDGPAQAGPNDGPWPSTIIQVSLPAVSADGSTAVLMASSISGPEAGGGAFYLLQRQLSGAWQIVATAEIWVS